MILQPLQKRCLLRWAVGARIAHAVARGLCPPRPPSMCFTSIDILAVGVDVVEVAAASTRERRCDDGHSSDCGQHPVGQPFSQHRGRTMAFCTPTQPAGWPQGHRTGRRPRTGAPAGYFCNKPKRCRLRKRKIDFFVRTHGYDGRGLPTAQHGCFSTNQ